MLGEKTKFARRKIAEFDRSNRDPFQGQNLMIEPGQHSPDFPILPLFQNDFENGA